VFGPVLDGRFVEDDTEIFRADPGATAKVPDDRPEEGLLLSAVRPGIRLTSITDSVVRPTWRQREVLLFSLADPDPEGGLRGCSASMNALRTLSIIDLRYSTGFPIRISNLYKRHSDHIRQASGRRRRLPRLPV